MKKTERLGERRIIEIIQNSLDIMPRMPIPFGDDVSAVDLGKGKAAILKTDMLVDKTDVPKGMSLWQAARKAIIMNVSDFAAKGVQPQAIMVSLGLPTGMTEKDVKQIGDGLNGGAREYGAFIVGGDTNEASDLIISISLYGTASKNTLMLRSGAKPGDIAAVTGTFGKTSAGLKILQQNLEMPEKISKVLTESVLMPHARLKEGIALGQTKAVTASIDSSDGLAWSLHEIAKMSNVGFKLDSVPMAKEVESFAKKHGFDPFELALYGGEEYELVLTIKPELWEKAEDAVRKVGGELLRIGHATTEKRVAVTVKGRSQIVEPRGWEHFKSKKV
jgi:thiamine-monophosphate kinase